MTTLILPFINFAILLGLLVYFMRTPFGRFVADRRESIVNGLNKSKLQVAEAEARRKEIERKLATLDSDRTEIFKEWKEREALQIKAIQESSQRILSQMKIEAEANRKALEEFARKDTLNKIALLTIETAQKKIAERLTPDAHKRINEKFSQEVTGLS